jgi:ZIP family zinc transporter
VVAVEILPDVTHRQHPLLLTIGFSLGVALMLALEWFSGHAKVGEDEEASTTSNISLLTALGVDVFLDGLLIAISFKAGANAGKLLALALSVELLSTALALASTLGRQGMSFARNVSINAAVFSLLVLGAVIGAWFSPYLDGVVLDLILSFGLAALLFLVTEELLVEAHKEPETAISTALFFIGFLSFLLLGMVHTA